MLKFIIIITTLYEYFCLDSNQMLINDENKIFENIDKVFNFVSNYYMEIFIFFFLIYFFIKLISYKKNKYFYYAKHWYSQNKEFFSSQYEIMGFGNKLNQEFDMLEENKRTYKFSASGRIHVKWMICLLMFGKKNYLCLTNKEKDKIIYKISLDSYNELPTVFCLCLRKDISVIMNNYIDIKVFTKTYSPQYILEDYVVLAENCEIFNEIINNKRIIEVYKEIESYLEMIYYSDQETQEQFTLYFSFHLNFKDTIQTNQEMLYKFTNFVHLFIDILNTYQMPTNYKKDALSKRNDAVRKYEGGGEKQNGKKIKSKKK